MQGVLLELGISTVLSQTVFNDPSDLFEDVRDHLALCLAQNVRLGSSDKLDWCELEHPDVIKEDSPEVAPVHSVDLS